MKHRTVVPSILFAFVGTAVLLILQPTPAQPQRKAHFSALCR